MSSDETPLESVFGSSALLKILDVLMEHPSMDYSKKDLADAAGIAESTVHRTWSKIEAIEAVEETRRYGSTKLYELNQDSEIIKQLYTMDQKIRSQIEHRNKIEA